MGMYKYEQVSDGVFKLYEKGVLLLEFPRKKVRESLESLCRGSNWVGSLIHILNKKYPLNYVCPIQQRSLCDRIGNDRLVNYLKSKGFRVYQNMEVKDRDIIDHLEKQGFIIEGLLKDNYYRSPLLICQDIMEDVFKS